MEKVRVLNQGICPTSNLIPPNTIPTVEISDFTLEPDAFCPTKRLINLPCRSRNGIDYVYKFVRDTFGKCDYPTFYPFIINPSQENIDRYLQGLDILVRGLPADISRDVQIIDFRGTNPQTKEMLIKVGLFCNPNKIKEIIDYLTKNAYALRESGVEVDKIINKLQNESAPWREAEKHYQEFIASVMSVRGEIWYQMVDTLKTDGLSLYDLEKRIRIHEYTHATDMLWRFNGNIAEMQELFLLDGTVEEKSLIGDLSTIGLLRTSKFLEGALEASAIIHECMGSLIRETENYSHYALLTRIAHLTALSCSDTQGVDSKVDLDFVLNGEGLYKEYLRGKLFPVHDIGTILLLFGDEFDPVFVCENLSLRFATSKSTALTREEIIKRAQLLVENPEEAERILLAAQDRVDALLKSLVEKYNNLFLQWFEKNIEIISRLDDHKNSKLFEYKERITAAKRESENP